MLRLVAACALVAGARAAEGAGMCAPARWNPAETSSAFVGHGYMNTTVESPADCCALCEQEAQCTAWNWKADALCFRYSGAVPALRHATQRSLTGTRAPPPPPPAPPPPAPKGAMNVLMIAIDDMRPELAPYGAAHMHTPNMQKLADRSLLFTRAYVQVAVCMPSRNALLFSRRPDTAMAWSISATQWPRTCGGGSCAGNECGPRCGIREPGAGGKLGVTLPGWFLQHGFFTAGAGKIFHEGSNTEEQDYKHSWTPSITNSNTGLCAWLPPPSCAPF